MLEALPDDAFDTYLERVVARYVESFPEKVIPREEILPKARRHVEQLLPQGRRTPGHTFRRIVVDGRPVGTLWWAEQLDETPPRVFIYDIEVDEQHRGEGAGTAALYALDDEARRLGAKEVMPSVFFNNPGAIRLYEQLGFRAVDVAESGMRMAKPL